MVLCTQPRVRRSLGRSPSRPRCEKWTRLLDRIRSGDVSSSFLIKYLLIIDGRLGILQWNEKKEERRDRSWHWTSCMAHSHLKYDVIPWFHDRLKVARRYRILCTLLDQYGLGRVRMLAVDANGGQLKLD